MYVAVGNPFGDSTKRAGMNLFTDSVLALSLDERPAGVGSTSSSTTTSGTMTTVFSRPSSIWRSTVKPVKALAQANKNSWLYILDRELRGNPVHPIIETPVPTETDTPGEQPWPTQPIPHKANGERMEPVSPVYPTKLPPGPDRRTRDRAAVHPARVESHCGAWIRWWRQLSGRSSYSSSTGLLYVNAIDNRRLTAVASPDGYFSAYDPTTGELVWRQIFEGYGQAGLSRHGWRCGVRRDRKQHRRLLFCVRCTRPESCSGSSIRELACSRRRRSIW